MALLSPEEQLGSCCVKRSSDSAIPLIISVFMAKLLCCPFGLPRANTNLLINTGSTGSSSFDFSSFDGTYSLIALSTDLKIVMEHVLVLTLYVYTHTKSYKFTQKISQLLSSVMWWIPNKKSRPDDIPLRH